MDTGVNKVNGPALYALSERALAVELGDEISEVVFARVMAVQRAILEATVAGVEDVVAAYTTVTVVFDPLAVVAHSAGASRSASALVRQKVETILDGVMANVAMPHAEPVVVPVCYEAEFALDLSWVAEHHQCTGEEIVRRHTAHTFTVFMIGFTPGFPYMGVLPAGLESPRKAVPRARVPAGSVGLAGKQTGIYPYTTPGGWQIIGRTPWALFDPSRQPPARLKQGDRIRFEAISGEEFKRLSR